MRKTGFVLAATLFCMVMALSLSATTIKSADDDNQRILTSITADQMQEILANEGYKAEVTEKGAVKLKLDGISSVIMFRNEGTNIQMDAWFKDKVSLDKVNAWNRDKRFSKAYVDSDGDLTIEFDLRFKGGITEAHVIDFIETCRASFNVFVQYMSEK